MRRRVYIAPLGVLLTLDAGAFDQVEYVIGSKSVVLGIVPAAASSSSVQAPVGRLLVSQPAVVSGVGTMVPSGTFTKDAGAYVVPFSSGRASVTVRPS
ncbi:hypothetical protein FRC08_003936 [Ceratobasidium sp. 394]|nr:hypothetical protein FRC08_003936 [Ceratobasidium sp. 394]